MKNHIFLKTLKGYKCDVLFKQKVDYLALVKNINKIDLDNLLHVIEQSAQKLKLNQFNYEKSMIILNDSENQNLT